MRSAARGAPASAAAAKAPGPKATAPASDRILLPSDVSPTAYRIAIKTDAEHLTFSGRVTISLQVARAAKTIKLNQADLKFTHVSLSGVAGEPQVDYDAKQETATLTFYRAVLILT